MTDEYPRLRDLLIKHEGIRLKAYDDATGDELKPGYRLIGHPTIGVGRALDVAGITELDSMRMLTEDIARTMQSCFDRFPWFWSIGAIRQDVVASMVFQMGMKGFLHFTLTIAALEKQNYQEAAEEMLRSAWARQVPKRALELSEIMRRGA